MRIFSLAALILFATAAGQARAEALSSRPNLNPGLQCRAAIRIAERAAGIPEQLMAAIARVESGRRGPDGVVNPWPWSINAEGTDYVYDTKEAVIAAVRALQTKGVRSIDVGCMQVNLMHHPQAFASLDQAFDPAENAHYAAQFLVQLKEQTGDWMKATAAYHSATPELGEPYQRKVMAVWPEEKQRGQMAELPELAARWSNPLRSVQSGGGQPGGGYMLSNRSASARVLPMAGATGRELDAYRAAPIPLASRAMERTPL
jgi:hypothetical protein